MAKQKTLAFSAELLDQLLDGQDPTTVLRSDGLMGELKKALAERMLNAEMDIHRRCCINRASPHIWGYEQAKTKVSHSELAGVQRRVGRTWIVDGVV